MSGRRVVASLLALMLCAAVTSVLSGAPPASADGSPSDSAVTVSGSGDFANLKVTVSQTTNLINQVVKVTWTGGAATPLTGGLQNFLQIMQCWGDDPAGPERTQCQFGQSGLSGGSAGRAILVPNPLNPSGLVDPAEHLKPADPTGAQGSYVPFWPVGGTQPTEATLDTNNSFFDKQVTNEVAVARTRSNGTGEVDFEIETGRQAAGLGCGDQVDVNGTISGRPCWLVIVPRGATEVNGNPPDFRGLQSSPLSQTNWNNKIAVRLEFIPQGQPCPLGSAERPVNGHELAVDAVSRWQPALCANGGALFNYLQLNDDATRSQLLGSTDPGLALISNPVSADLQRPDRPLVYAPVALSGLVVAFRIVKNPPNLSGPDDVRREVAGEPFTEMSLTPRLVAKLLTQSYQGAVVHKTVGAPPNEPGAPPGIPSTNPEGLTNDPDFLDVNHGYRDLMPLNAHVDALVQLGTSDLTGLLWDWVLADPDARAFVDGTPDPWKMVVNNSNKGLRPPLYTYPRNDPACKQVVGNGGLAGEINAPFCTTDAHLYALDMHEAGRSASRGDALAGNGQDPSINPVDGRVSYGKAPRQPVTEQALIAVVDAATAMRYGLQIAKLRNAAGQFVAPDEAGLQAGLNVMTPSSVKGVLQPDPATTNPAAYPLTTISNAVTSPPALTKEAGRDYAAFIRYAVGPGQQPGLLPGQLPFGYLPLPEPLRQQALAAATIIETQAGKSSGLPPSPPDTSSPVTTGPDLSGPAAPNTSQPSSISPNTVSDGNTAPPAVIPPGVGSPAVVPGTTSGPANVAVRRTPPLPAPAVGALLLTILIAGALAAASSPVLQSPVIYRLSGAIRRMRKGVGPTEQ